MQNLSRLHRGFIEACKNYWFFICKTYRGFIEASSRLAKTIGFAYAKPIETSLRLHRGLQTLLVCHMQNLSRLHRGFIEAYKDYWFCICKPYRGFIEANKNYYFFTCKTYRGFSEASSRLNNQRSNLSLTESVRLKWLFDFVTPTHTSTCVSKRWLGNGDRIQILQQCGCKATGSPSRLLWDSPLSIIKPESPKPRCF